MKTLILIAWLIAIPAIQAEENVAVMATSGRFKVTQEFQEEAVETVRFRDPKIPAVRLGGLSWRGIYTVSPDERWLLRTQKTGSGASMVMLYCIEENGRVSEVIGFDALLWELSDQNSRLKKKDLYHTGVDETRWSADGSTLEIDLSGSNAAENGDGIETHLVYNLKTNKAVVKTAKREKGDAAIPAKAE